MSSGVPHDLHRQYLSQGKEKLILKYILCLKRRSRLRPRPLARNCTRQILQWNHQANELQLPYSLKPVKANVNDLELNGICYIFAYSSSLKCSEQTFSVPSAIVNSFPSSVFPSEVNGQTERANCGRFHSLLVAFRNTKLAARARAATEWSAIFAFGAFVSFSCRFWWSLPELCINLTLEIVNHSLEVFTLLRKPFHCPFTDRFRL